MKLGIDLGGTKIEAIVIDASNQVMWRQRRPSPQNNYQSIISVIGGLVQEAKQDCDLASNFPVGIGTPGALCRPLNANEAVMKNCNSVVLNGQPLLKDLSSALACPVKIANDANCFALAETHAGCGKELFADQLPEASLGLILGTGVGAGLVVNGKLLQGLHSISGEWGHNHLPATVLEKLPANERHRSCYCGRKNCVETFLSGPGLALSYRLRFGKSISPEQIVSDMRAGDADAHGIWHSYLEQLAASLAQVVNILDPQLIVLGGGLSNITEIYPAISSLMAPQVFSDDFLTPIRPAVLGDSAGVYGAAWLWH